MLTFVTLKDDTIDLNVICYNPPEGMKSTRRHPNKVLPDFCPWSFIHTLSSPWSEYCTLVVSWQVVNKLGGMIFKASSLKDKLSDMMLGQVRLGCRGYTPVQTIQSKLKSLCLGLMKSWSHKATQQLHHPRNACNNWLESFGITPAQIWSPTIARACLISVWRGSGECQNLMR